MNIDNWISLCVSICCIDRVFLVVVAIQPLAYGDGVLDIVGTTMVTSTKYAILPIKVKIVNVVLI